MKVREVLNCELVIEVLLQLLSWTDVARMCLSISESLTPSPLFCAYTNLPSVTW